ncbi:unnamed protein product [Cuscuta campestris]|uniref:Reverse transcriptase domain-containing protein n=1 Tax=Cuscuta campestris TaxID=132261 RepID=A0A484ML94_9ASTE|nr:unnamed protein product [Cuscuta campestris]
MSNESRTMSHEELIASNTALKAQLEYLAKEVAKLTKMKLNELQGSDREEDVSSCGTMKPKANEGSDFKVDIPTFEGKNDPDEFLEWLETVERVFDFKDVSNEKKVKIVALKFRKYASTWWTNTCTKRRRNDKEPVSTWVKMRSLLKKKFLPAEYVRENFAKLQTLRQGSKSVEEYNREFEELLLRCDLQEDDEQTFVRYLFGLNLQIANTVELQSYDSLEELMKLALKVEAQHKKSKAFFSKNNTPSPRPYSSTSKPPYPSSKLPYTTPKNPTTAHGTNPSSSSQSTSRNPSSSFTPRDDPTKKAPELYKEDEDFKDTYSKCLIRPYGDFLVKDGYLFRGNQLCVPQCMVSDYWAHSPRTGGMTGFASKLKGLKPVLAHWSKNHFGNIFKEVKDNEIKAARAQEDFENDPTEKKRAEANLASANLILSLNKEVDFWKQKANIKWMSEGNCNSKFFHSFVKSKRRKLAIKTIHDDLGNILTTQEDICREAIHYFSNCYTTVTQSDETIISQFIDQVIYDRDNQLICSLPSEAEIYKAILNLNPDSAASPDGFNGYFFRICWNIIKVDVILACQEFFLGFPVPRSFGSTFITLIAKIEDPKGFGDYKPISLSSFMSKSNTKILATRLATLLPKFISEEQTGFQKNKGVEEQILLAEEMVHMLDKEVRGDNCIVKLDMAKAFDRVEWSYLIKILDKLGFNLHSQKLLMANLVGLHLSILINGSPAGFFQMKRGVKQGDPLSPLLFLISSEGFTRMINLHMNSTYLGSYNTGNHPLISHLAFADDLVVFLNGDTRNLKKFRRILEVYQKGSGQQVNLNKSSFYTGKKVNQTKIASMFRSLCMDHGTLPLFRERLEAEDKADKIVNDLRKAIELKRSLQPQDPQLEEVNAQKEALEPKTNPEPSNHQVPVLEDSPSSTLSHKPESITTLAGATVVMLPEYPPSQVSTGTVVHEVEPTEELDSEPPMLIQEQKEEEVLPMAINDHILNCVEDTPPEEPVLEKIEPTTYPQDSNVQEYKEESIDEEIPSTEEPITSIDNHASSEDLDQTFFVSLLDGCDFVCPKDSWSQKSWDELLVSDTEDSSMGESIVVIIKPQMDGQPVEDKEKINLAMKANDVDQLRRLPPPPTYLESPPFILLPPSRRDESRILDHDRATNQTRWHQKRVRRAKLYDSRIGKSRKKWGIPYSGSEEDVSPGESTSRGTKIKTIFNPKPTRHGMELIPQKKDTQSNQQLTAAVQTLLEKMQSLETSINMTRSNDSSGSSTHHRTSPFTHVGNSQPQTKLFFLKFTGDDPIGWLYLSEQYFEFAKIPVDQQVSLASFHMEGIALQWYRWYTKFKGPLTWGELTQAVLQRFGPTDFEDPSGALSHLTQTTTVAAYTESFEQLSHRVDGLPEPFLIGCYIAGLKEEIRYDVKVKKPKNLSEAIGVARVIEEKNNTQRRQPSNNRFTPAGSSARSNPVQPWTIGPASECTITSQACCPLSKSSTMHPQTIRLMGKIGNKQVMVLVDGGSTHNFIEHSLVTRFGLVINREEMFEVMVANRERISCVGLVRDLTLTVQGYNITTDYYVLPVAACQIVLGVQWMKTLGPVELDYQRLTLRFKIGDSSHSLEGIKQPNSTEALTDKELQSLHGMGEFGATTASGRL